MKKIICSSFLLATTGSLAAAITAVTTGASVGGGYEIVFKNAGVVPTAFNTNSPASIVLDFPNTTSGVANRETPVNQNGVYSVNVIPGDGRTRAVVNLANPMPYNVRLVGSDVHVVLNGAGGGTVAPVAAAPVAAAPVATGGGLFNSVATVQGGGNIQPVSLNSAGQSQAASVPDLAPMFHRNANKGGVLTFTLPSRDTSVNVKTEGSSVVAIISGYQVPKAGQKRLDVADYGSPVRFVDILPSGADTKVVLNMGRDAYEYVTYQEGASYNIEIKRPAVDAEQQRIRELTGFGSGKQYSGQALSLNFQDIEVRAVLQIIAEFTNNNIVVSDSVVGNITLRLDNVPWDQALDIIMKTKGLAMRRVDKVIYVAPEGELNDAEIAAMRAEQEKLELTPTVTETIQLKYAKASDIAKMIEDGMKQLSSSSGTSSTNRYNDAIMSGKGTIASDDRTNRLIVTDIPAKIQKVRDLVARLDEPVRQVLIDSRLVVTEDTYSRSIGSRFGVSFARGVDFANASRTVGTGTLSGTTEMLQNNTLDLNNRLGVNLGVGSTAVPSYGISILGSDVLVDLELQALQAEGLSETISSPRVVTQDGYPATVAAGEEIPYSSVSDSGTNTEFKEALLSMEVTPRIAPNDRVTMEINVTQDSVGSRMTNGEPSIETNRINTKVEVETGETIVLGGIYRQTQRLQESKVPVLGDIPVVGSAFRNKAQTFDKNELLVFLTPRILEGRMTNVDKFSNLRD